MCSPAKVPKVIQDLNDSEKELSAEEDQNNLNLELESATLNRSDEQEGRNSALDWMYSESLLSSDDDVANQEEASAASNPTGDKCENPEDLLASSTDQDESDEERDVIPDLIDPTLAQAEAKDDAMEGESVPNQSLFVESKRKLPHSAKVDENVSVSPSTSASAESLFEEVPENNREVAGESSNSITSDVKKIQPNIKDSNTPAETDEEEAQKLVNPDEPRAEQSSNPVATASRQSFMTFHKRIECQPGMPILGCSQAPQSAIPLPSEGISTTFRQLLQERLSVIPINPEYFARIEVTARLIVDGSVIETVEIVTEDPNASEVLRFDVNIELGHVPGSEPQNDKPKPA